MMRRLLTLVLLAAVCLVGCGDNDNSTGRLWGLTGSLNVARDAHTATLLPDDTVLVVGGYDGDVLASTEIYDPASGTWNTTGSLNEARSHHTVTLLPNDTVLVVGGNRDDDTLASVELYDPLSGTWSTTSSLENGRQDHTATLLPDGMVLVVGGVAGPPDSAKPLNSAILYDTVSGTWNRTGSLNDARFYHTATLLPDGMVLVAGGQGVNGTVTSAEIYNPALGTWNTTSSLNTGRHNYTATLLPNGMVLVAGGAAGSPTDVTYLSSAELYDPVSGTWRATGSLHIERGLHSSSLLPSGLVLSIGGEQGSEYLASVEVYDPASGNWTITESLYAGRVRFTATFMVNGMVLVVGGYNGSGVLSSAELFCESGLP